MGPDLATLRRVPWQPGTALLLADLAWLDGSGPVVASPRQILRRQLDRLAEHGLTAYVGTELEFVRLPRLLRGGLAARLPRPHPGQPVQRRLLAARHRPGRAAAAPHPHRDGRRRADPGERQGRVQPRPARDRLPVRRGAGTAADNHVIYKNGAKEIAAQEGMSITFMAKPNEREGNSCHIHFSLRDADGALGDGRRRAGAACRRPGSGCSPGCSPRMRELTLLLRPEHQLLQAVPARLVRADRACAGAPTTAPARCGWSGTGRRCGWRTGCPAATSTRTWRSPRWSRARCTASSRSWSWSDGVRRQRVRRPDAPTGCPATLRDALDPLGVLDGRPGRVRRRGGRPLRQQGPGRAGRLRRRGHRLGAVPWLRTPLTRRTPSAIAWRRSEAAAAARCKIVEAARAA